MTATSTDGQPTHGGPWRCPSCGRATVRNYRCSNWDCAIDLVEHELQSIRDQSDE